MRRCAQAYGALALAAALWVPLSAAAQPQATDTRPVPAVHRASPLPVDWHHGAFMEIFVRAWRDSDGDGIGDLRGLTQSLDYLKDLGVRGLWLMPITRNADGDHGYATTDFRDWYVWSDEAPPGWDIWGKYPWYHTAAQPWLHRGKAARR